jgi:hypothetical protein
LKIQFLGAAQTVTGSRTLVQVGTKKILVDCGLFQGFKHLRLRNREPLPIAASEIDVVLLTHAHLDHSGAIPLLVKEGFKGSIYCTKATRDLCGILLPDSGYLQEEEAKKKKLGTPTNVATRNTNRLCPFTLKKTPLPRSPRSSRSIGIDPSISATESSSSFTAPVICSEPRVFSFRRAARPSRFRAISVVKTIPSYPRPIFEVLPIPSSSNRRTEIGIMKNDRRSKS